MCIYYQASISSSFRFPLSHFTVHYKWPKTYRRDVCDISIFLIWHVLVYSFFVVYIKVEIDAEIIRKMRLNFIIKGTSP